MPVPKRKVSKSRRDSRSANKGIKPKAVASCQTCQAAIIAHAVCKDCGYYKGVKILKTKTDRKYERVQTREAMQSKMQARQPVAPSSDEQGSGESAK